MRNSSLDKNEEKSGKTIKSNSSQNYCTEVQQQKRKPGRPKKVPKDEMGANGGKRGKIRKSYICPKCSEVCPTRGQLQAHRMKFCTQGKRKKTLKKTRKHNDCPPNDSEQNQKKENTACDKNESQELTPNPKQKMLICQYCQKAFKYRSELSRHNIYYCESNQSRKEIICRNCNLKFTSHHIMYSHRKHCKNKQENHTEEGKVKDANHCQFCNKKFETILAQRRHSTYFCNANPSKKPIKCFQCGKNFNKFWRLNKHRKIGCETEEREESHIQNITEAEVKTAKAAILPDIAERITESVDTNEEVEVECKFCNARAVLKETANLTESQRYIFYAK